MTKGCIILFDVLRELVENRKVLILGFGKEGKSTYKLLRELKLCSKIDIADIKIHDDFDETDTKFFFGEHYLDNMNLYDIVFKSPGIVLPNGIEQYNCTITSQTEVFLKAYSRQVIGITGTKGKSTVSSLFYHVLNNNNISCLLAGNIGIPVFDIIKDINDDTVVILELSCHQLEYCMYSPSVAILLNIFEDHLDHYGTFEKYKAVKKNVYLYQRPLDTLYCSDSIVLDRKEFLSRVYYVNTSNLPLNSLDTDSGILLRGHHNLENCAFVYEISRSFGISDEEFITSLQTYRPLRHRLEFIGAKKGVNYYDDSISTTVESTISAINSIDNASTIIIGGMDRGINYTPLVDFLSNSKITNIILMYESGKRIYNMLLESKYIRDDLNIVFEPDLYTATDTAQKVSLSGTACILSPASASYNDFKNFEERGMVFKEILFKDASPKT